MKKVLLTMVGALVFMSMMAATGADKKDGVKTPVSRTDCVTKTEMQMFGLSLDGFGLDAEEYELLMTQDFDLFDDLAGTITVPSCAGENRSLNGVGNGSSFQRNPKDWDEPIPRPVPGFPNSASDFSRENLGGSPLDGEVKGNVRPGNEPNVAPEGDGSSLQGTRRPKDWDEPIDPVPRVSTHGAPDLSGGSSGGSSLNDMIKGNVRLSNEPNVAPEGDGSSLQRTREWDEPIIPIGPGSFTGLPDRPDGTSGGSSFDDMIKGNVRPGSTPSLNGSRPTKPIGPGPIDF